MSKVIFSQEQLQELRHLVDSGVRQTDIAKHFGITDDTIRRICRENDIEIRMPHKCVCILCGETFYSNVKTAKVCKKEHKRNCVICGKEFVVDRTHIRETCSLKCTSIQKYGVEHHLKSKEVIDKRIHTLQEEYGVNSVSQLDSVKQKVAQTYLERYGGHPMANKDIVEKRR